MRNQAFCLLLTSLALSACAGTQTRPIDSKCFNARGDLTCDLRPLSDLWSEARQDAVRQVGRYEGVVQDGPYAIP